MNLDNFCKVLLTCDVSCLQIQEAHQLGGASQNVVPLKLKISADILCVISGDLRWPNCWAPSQRTFTHFYAVFNCNLQPTRSS